MGEVEWQHMMMACEDAFDQYVCAARQTLEILKSSEGAVADGERMRLAGQRQRENAAFERYQKLRLALFERLDRSSDEGTEDGG